MHYQPILNFLVYGVLARIDGLITEGRESFTGRSTSACDSSDDISFNDLTASAITYSNSSCFHGMLFDTESQLNFNIFPFISTNSLLLNFFERYNNGEIFP